MSLPIPSRPIQFVASAAKFVVPAIIVAVLLWRIPSEDWERIGQQQKNYSLIAAAVAVAVGAMCVSFARWCVLVRAQGIELSMLEAFRLGSIGYLLSFVSAGSVGGDVFKAAFLARRRPGKRFAAVASVFVDRGCGLYGLLLLVAAGMAAVGVGQNTQTSGQIDLSMIRYATYGLIAAGTTVLAILILGGRGVDRFIAKAEKWPLVGGLVHRIGPPLRTFGTHRLQFAIAVLMSVAVQSLLVISMLLIARGLYDDPPGAAEHFVIVPIGMLVSALPVTPAGVGVLEVAIDTMYGLFQNESSIASGTLVALVFELVKLIVAGVGVVFYWTAPAEVMESLQGGSPDDIDISEPDGLSATDGLSHEPQRSEQNNVPGNATGNATGNAAIGQSI